MLRVSQGHRCEQYTELQIAVGIHISSPKLFTHSHDSLSRLVCSAINVQGIVIVSKKQNLEQHPDGCCEALTHIW